MTTRSLGDYWQALRRAGLLVPGGALRARLLETPVALVTCNSQEAGPGSLFLVKGAHFRGEYLRDAVARGALCYVAERPWAEGEAVPALLVTDIRRAMGLLADLFYGHPSGEVAVVGITGTKGKSTTAYYLKSIFDAYRRERGEDGESGLISSIDTYDGVERFESHLTTPEPLDLQRHLRHAADSGLRYLTMEVSSQALKYGRLDGVELAAGAFLNLGYDHISPAEHPDFEDYFQSKLRIFEHTSLACVNLDSERSAEVLAAAAKCRRVVTFSRGDETAQVYGWDAKKEVGGLSFRARTPRWSQALRLTMPGLFNVENALAAIALCEALGIPRSAVAAGLARAKAPGRMEVYESAGGAVSAIVDYAHNRLSFETLFRSVRAEYPGRRVVIVFGCPGGKALDRRHDLGAIAGKYADLTYITEEDPGEEPVEDISREVAAAVEASGGKYVLEPCRERAIAQAILETKEPTVVLITGKGAETRQKRGLTYVPVPSDVDCAKAALALRDREGR